MKGRYMDNPEPKTEKSFLDGFVDSIKTAGQTYGRFFTGDFKGAKEAALAYGENDQLMKEKVVNTIKAINENETIQKLNQVETKVADAIFKSNDDLEGLKNVGNAYKDAFGTYKEIIQDIGGKKVVDACNKTLPTACPTPNEICTEQIKTR